MTSGWGHLITKDGERGDWELEAEWVVIFVQSGPGYKIQFRSRSS
jgi:hypothetical protein